MTSDGFSEPLSYDCGVLQGDTLAPFLFVIVLDYALRRALDRDPSLTAITRETIGSASKWGFVLRPRRGSREPALFITDMVYADDIALLAPSFAVAQRMIDAVIRETSIAGLSINVQKTKYMVRGDLSSAEHNSEELFVGASPIARVDDFKYLGSYIGSVDADILARCKAATQAFGRLLPVWKAPLQVPTKLRVFKTMVEPILFYGCESWPLTAERERKISTCWFSMVRRIVNRRWPYVRQSDASILSEFKLISPLQSVRIRFLKHFGHSLRSSQREKSAGVKQSPLSMVVQWAGEHGSQCTLRRGVVRQRCVQRRGKANLCTTLSYCLRLLGLSTTDSRKLLDLAQSRASWVSLVESASFC